MNVVIDLKEDEILMESSSMLKCDNFLKELIHANVSYKVGYSDNRKKYDLEHKKESDRYAIIELKKLRGKL